VAAPGPEPTAPGPSVRPLVVGLGHPARHDDAFGLEVADRLARDLGGRCDVRRCPSDGTELLDLWGGRDLVVVIDAVSAGGAPGSIYRLEVGDLPIPPPFRGTSTHGFSIAEVIALARSLDRLPRRLVLFGVEGASFAPGLGLSPSVTPAVEAVARRVVEELGRSTPPHDAIPREGRGRA